MKIYLTQDFANKKKGEAILASPHLADTLIKEGKASLEPQKRKVKNEPISND
jgi:hypothetical protein